MELEFGEGGTVVVARLSCLGEPGLLQSGKRGWFERSTHLEWRCGWRLCANWSVTAPGPDYSYSRPEAGKHRFGFVDSVSRWRPWDLGRLVVEGRSLTARFVIPDCFDKAPFKSFAWGEPILIEGEMFHCQLRLEVHGPRDGSYLVRRTATRDFVGGIDFMSADEEILAQVCDSEGADGKGRVERVLAMWRERNGSRAPLRVDSLLPGALWARP